jgi:peptidoglycan/LPS O-acetylase OafA/YrhL
VATPRLDSLTSLRFFAALLVVVAHVGGMSSSDTVRTVSHHGAVGVGFFFILSGFVLAWSNSAKVATWAFYRRRFARVYPLHAVTWAIAVALGLVGLLDAGGHTAQAINLVLLQSWSSDLGIVFSANIPAWSLSNEAFFYLLFPVIALAIARLANSARWAVLGLVALAVVVVLPWTTDSDYLLYLFPPTRLLEFISGVILACLMRSGWRSPIGLVPAVVLTIASIAWVSQVEGSFGIVAITAIPLWLLIAAAATNDATGGTSPLQRPWLVRLGVWSFALYLVHNIVIGLVLRFSGAIDAVALIPVGVAVTAVSIALSGLAYHYIERPAEARLRGPGRTAVSLDG